MNRGEQLRLVRQVLADQLTDTPGYVRAMLGRRAQVNGVELREPPDSALSRAAVAEARESLPSELFEHSVRCWYLGDLFGQLDGVRADPELLHVTCMLHDLGLTERYDPGATDFAAHGAEVAREFARARGSDDATSAVVADAIVRHMDMTASRERPEAYLLHEAAHCDAAARRVGDLPANVTASLLQRHPRDGFVEAFAEAMRTEARERPGTRAAVLWHLGMGLRLRHNPLDRSGR